MYIYLYIHVYIYVHIHIHLHIYIIFWHFIFQNRFVFLSWGVSFNYDSADIGG